MREVRSGHRPRWSQRLAKLLLVGLLAGGLGAAAPPRAAHAAEPFITIGSHRAGDLVRVGTVRVSGRYRGMYDLLIVVGGQRTAPVRTSAPNTTDTGTWWYDLDTSGDDGSVEIAVRGTSVVTRYWVYSPFVALRIDNAAASTPQVRITSPADASTVGPAVTVQVAVTARNPVDRVAVRVNGGEWLAAGWSGTTYQATWTAPWTGRAACVQARAVDVAGNIGYSGTTYVAVGAVTVPPIRAAQLGRAMWLWEDAASYLVVNGGSRAVLDAVVSDTTTFHSDPVRTIYFGVGRYTDFDMVTERTAELRDMLTWAHARGLRVYALIAGGTRPAFLGGLRQYRPYAVRELEKVLNFNLGAGNATQRFDGVNVDIEPYLIGAPFFGTSPDVRLQWLDTLRTLMDRRDASRTGIPVGPAMPVWLDLPEHRVTWHGVLKDLSAHMQDISDYVALMDYRDRADRIIDDAANEIRYAAAIGKPGTVVVGVETGDQFPSGGDPPSVTFYEEGRAALETVLRTVATTFGTQPGYGGVAVHHYDSLVGLPSTWGAGGLYLPLPVDGVPPTALSGPVRAIALDHQSVELTFGRAYDNGDVRGYRVYRSTAAFGAGPGTPVGWARGLTFTDSGLLPGTTYHYRVAAVDAAGNVGPASAAATVGTLAGTLRPMILGAATVTRSAGRLHATVRVVDRATGAPVANALLYAWFTRSADEYVTLRTGGTGWASVDSAPVTAPTGAAGFRVHRVLADGGRYWAGAYGTASAPEITW